MTIDIRPLQDTDMKDVVSMLDRNLSAYMPAAADLPTIWADFTRQDHVHACVAVVDGQVVGYGALVVEIKIRGGKMGHIEDVVTHEDFRQQGIGRAIVHALTARAESCGCYKVALQCKEHNIPFYEKTGYEVSGLFMQHFLR